MKKTEDSILVQKVKEGDKDAFGELVERHKRQIYFAVYRMTNNHCDADDLSQEAFIRAYESINSYREKASFSTWVYRIAMNITINHLKKSGKRQTVTLDENILIRGANLAIHTDNPRKNIESRELHEEITKAIESLPLKQKTVVVLAIIEGLSHGEIAEIQGCLEKTVSWRLFHARKKLKVKLKKYIS